MPRKLSPQEMKELFDALHFMNMKELRDLCKTYNIPWQEGKAELIKKIMHFLKTGTVLPAKTIPAISRAQKCMNYPLAENTPVLYGAYKNDLKTRIFFKKLIGPHFHFTAFGVDWINARWHDGNPPTYKEFAQMWQKEYELRKKTKAQPKKEWALLTFMQEYQHHHPDASKQQVMAAWKKEREMQVKHARELLSKLV